MTIVTRITEEFALALQETAKVKRGLKMRSQWLPLDEPKFVDAYAKVYRNGKSILRARSVAQFRRIHTKRKYHNDPAYRRPGDPRLVTQTSGGKVEFNL